MIGRCNRPRPLSKASQWTLLDPPRQRSRRGTVSFAQPLGPAGSHRSDHAIPAGRFGISTPTTCLPAFALSRKAMPGHCMPRSVLCVMPCTRSPFVPAPSVPHAANDVASTARDSRLVSFSCSSSTPCYYCYRTCVCLALTALRPARRSASVPPAPRSDHRPGGIFSSLRHQTDFFPPKWACLVIRSAKAARSPSERRQLLGPHQSSRQNRHETRVIGQLRHLLPFGEREFRPLRRQIAKPVSQPLDHPDHRALRSRSKSLGASIWPFDKMLLAEQ